MRKNSEVKKMMNFLQGHKTFEHMQRCNGEELEKRNGRLRQQKKLSVSSCVCSLFMLGKQINNQITKKQAFMNNPIGF